MTEIITVIATTANTLTWPAAFAIVGVAAAAAVVAVVFIFMLMR